jgi:hypothetical protein
MEQLNATKKARKALLSTLAGRWSTRIVLILAGIVIAIATVKNYLSPLAADREFGNGGVALLVLIAFALYAHFKNNK